MTLVKVGRKIFSEDFVREHFPSALEKDRVYTSIYTKNLEECNMTGKMTLAVSLPRGVQEQNFASLVGTLRPKKFKDSGKEIKTKTGKDVYSIAFDITKLKAMMSKYPSIVVKDKKSGNDIVWLTGFSGTTETKSW